jgi:hypothetical protein
MFVPEQVLESQFKSRLKEKLRQAGLLDQVPDSVWQGRFVVNSKAVGSGEHALKYLAPYVTRGCVANWRVTACDECESIDDARLTLQFKRTGTRKYRGLTLTVTEFIRRWLLHVCPCGFHRVRHYGLLNARSKRSIEEVRLLIAVEQNRLLYLTSTEQLETPSPEKMTCPKCGGPMFFVGYQPPPNDQSLAGNGRSPPKRGPP